MKDIVERTYPITDRTNFKRRNELQKALKDRFTQGYICACANLMNMYGESTMVEEVLRGNFTSAKELKDCGVEETDIETLMPVIKEIERKRKLNNA
jgi:hypothetical protein